MEKINIRDVPIRHQVWEDGRFNRKRKDISVALGSTKEKPHPFDVELTSVAPQAYNCPFHKHSERTEFFIIVSGQAIVYRNDSTFEVNAGDCFIQHPKTAHRMFNPSETDELVFYVIADEVANDIQEKIHL